MRLYSKVAALVCSYLVTDFDHVRTVNEDGVFTLARALAGPQTGEIELRALLLASCKQSINDYKQLCEKIYETIVTENKARKSRIINDEQVLELANSLKPFELNTAYEGAHSQDKMLSRNEAFNLCSTNSEIPEVLETLLGKTGVTVKEV